MRRVRRARRLRVVGLDASHEVRAARADLRHQRRERRAELSDERLLALRAARELLRRRHLALERRLEPALGGAAHEREHVVREPVAIPIDEARDVVGHLAGVVGDRERIGSPRPRVAQHARDLVVLDDLTQEVVVGAVAQTALLIDQRQQACAHVEACLIHSADARSRVWFAHRRACRAVCAARPSCRRCEYPRTRRPPSRTRLAQGR